jgi:Type IV secretion-system coupling protein DNA-binding domain
MREVGEVAPPKTLEERLTLQFYRWEKRGRGWAVFPYPVLLEPPFRRFLGHFLMPTPAPIDDGRKHTWISSLIERLAGASSSPGNEADRSLPIEAEPGPDVFRDEGLIELEVTPAERFVAEQSLSERFLLSLSSQSAPMAFEVFGGPEGAGVALVARLSDEDLLREQVKAFFPDAAARERQRSLSSRWRDDSESTTVAVDFGLLREFMLPLRTFSKLDPDPLIPVFGAMGGLKKGELALFQILFEPARAPWAESVMRAVSDGEGGSFFVDAPDMVKLAGQKISRPLYAVVLRAGVRSRDPDRAWDVLRRLSGAIAQFGVPDGNELIPLSVEGDHDPREDLLNHRTHRSGMLLSTEELVSLLHLPGASVRHARIAREEQTKSKLPPPVTRGDGSLIGENLHRGRRTPVRLPTEIRMRHTHVIGASGTGKSTLLLSLILQDIDRGEGVAVLDPHGDLIEEILARIPEERASDVVLLDPSDEDYPVGVNVLSARSERERTLLSSDLVAIFRRLSTTWGDQMHSIFANAIQAFLDSEQGGTLVDLRRFLIEDDFRERFLRTVRDPGVVYYFEKEFSLLVGRPQGPILTRLDSFLRPRLIRAMVAQRESRIDFRAIVDEGKVLLVKLAEGAIGEENAALLGSLLVAKLQQVAMSREDVRPELRRPFHLVIDEFHHFVTPSMAALLSAARKYRVGLTLAHQELRQIDSRDREVSSALLTNAATRIVFRVGDEDAKKLEGGFAYFDAMDLKNLGVGEAICRVDRAENDFNLETTALPAVEEASAAAGKARVVALARQRFARRREEVERELAVALESSPAVSTPSPRRERMPQPPPPAEKAAPPAVVMPKPRPQSPAPLGRGGSQHKYLQELVKRWGEGHGYRATIERQILAGLGSVDVALDRGERSVACEISVASNADQELGNIEKCLAAGFDEVAVVSLEKQNLRRAREVISSNLEEHLRERVHFLTPEELFTFLEAQPEAPEDSEEIVGGYRVRVSYKAVGPKEKKAKTRAVSEVILRTVRRLKGE